MQKKHWADNVKQPLLTQDIVILRILPQSPKRPIFWFLFNDKQTKSSFTIRNVTPIHARKDSKCDYVRLIKRINVGAIRSLTKMHVSNVLDSVIVQKIKKAELLVDPFLRMHLSVYRKVSSFLYHKRNMIYENKK